MIRHLKDNKIQLNKEVMYKYHISEKEKPYVQLKKYKIRKIKQKTFITSVFQANVILLTIKQ